MFGSPLAHVGDNPAKKERRSWDRIPVQISVFCQNVQGHDELCWSARVMDISRGGMKLLSPHKFAPTTVIQIGRADGFEESFRLLQASIVWTHRPPGEKWTGLLPHQGIERSRVARLDRQKRLSIELCHPNLIATNRFARSVRRGSRLPALIGSESITGPSIPPQ
jgi:hypothetical protein